MSAVKQFAARQNWHRFALCLIVLLAASLFLFFWREARNEVYFLCSNFRPGTSEASVISQLQTGDFLSYVIAGADDGGAVIIVSSPLSVITGECIIELNSNRVVREAVYR